MFRTAANGANWNLSVIRYALRHHCYGMKNRHRERTIHLRSHHANMSHHRCCAMSIHRRYCAILSRNPSRIHASHCEAEADYIWAHCVEPADCNAARSVARAMHCPAALWA